MLDFIVDQIDQVMLEKECSIEEAVKLIEKELEDKQVD